MEKLKTAKKLMRWEDKVGYRCEWGCNDFILFGSKVPRLVCVVSLKLSTTKLLHTKDAGLGQSFRQLYETGANLRQLS